MITSQKIKNIKNHMIEILKENKKIIVIGMSVGIGAMVLMLNMHQFQMIYYKMQDDTTKITEILKRDIHKEFRQDDWYFQTGTTYLIENLTDESKLFLEQYFKDFDIELQMSIIEAYNRQDLTFRDNTEIFKAIVVSEDTKLYRTYVNNLSVEEIERTLKLNFGASPQLTQDVVAQIYKILELQSQKITMDTFFIDVYELISFPHNGDMESVSLKLLDYIEPESVKENLFGELKTTQVEIEVFSTWIDILNKKKIITTEEYAGFTNSYGNIKRMQEQYKQTLMQEVDLHNIRQMSDVQTEEITSELDKTIQEVENLKQANAAAREELSVLQNYKEVELYVLDQYQNGDYEVAIPERSWLFGTYKPSNQRIRLKVTKTIIDEQGVMYFNVYNQGRDEDDLPYYVEVSDAEMNKISELDKDIKESEAEILEKEASITRLNQEIQQIRTTNNYDQTLLLIEEVERKKENLELDIKKEKVNIQNLFQIGELIINISR